jgi:ribosomal protein S27AE
MNSTKKEAPPAKRTLSTTLGSAGVIVNDPFCPQCGSAQTVAIRCEHGIHYAKQCCERCGTFLKWLPNPSTEIRRKEMQHKLRVLSEHPDRLSQWERGFVDSLLTQKKLSPKQRDIVERIWTERGF